MAFEIRFVPGQGLDADGSDVGNDVDDPVDHQEWIPVGDHVHDLLEVVCRVAGFGFVVHVFFALLPIFCITATPRSHSRIGRAGNPPTVAPASISPMTPALAEIRAPSPIFK